MAAAAGDARTPVRALVFDVFGTLVDWRTGVARELRRLLDPPVDAEALADAWRARYQPAMEEVRSGRQPFRKLDVLHRRNLDDVLLAAGHEALPEPLRAELTLAWHRLDAWPDVGPGLARLRERFLLAPCSNGHIALMAALARRNGWHWDAILGAELAGAYKPDPVVYVTAASAFDLPPAAVMMVAAHSSDLAAAAAAGLRTAFIARPDEHGPGRGESLPTAPVDLVCASLPELAQRLADPVP